MCAGFIPPKPIEIINLSPLKKTEVLGIRKKRTEILPLNSLILALLNTVFLGFALLYLKLQLQKRFWDVDKFLELCILLHLIMNFVLMFLYFSTV